MNLPLVCTAVVVQGGRQSLSSPNIKCLQTDDLRWFTESPETSFRSPPAHNGLNFAVQQSSRHFLTYSRSHLEKEEVDE